MSGKTTYKHYLTKSEPILLMSEIELAIRQLKTNITPGPHEMYPEILKLIKNYNINLSGIPYDQIYDTGHIPKERLESIFIPNANNTGTTDL